MSAWGNDVERRARFSQSKARTPKQTAPTANHVRGLCAKGWACCQNWLRLKTAVLWGFSLSHFDFGGAETFPTRPMCVFSATTLRVEIRKASYFPDGGAKRNKLARRRARGTGSRGRKVENRISG